MSLNKFAQAVQEARKAGSWIKPEGKSVDLHSAVDARVKKKEHAKNKPQNEVAQNELKAIRNLFASEFVGKEAALPYDALGNLNTEILDLFRAANFPHVKDYEVIAPSARLASLLLQHSSLWSMLRTILGHGRMIPLDEEDVDKKPMYQYPPDDMGQFAVKYVGVLHEAWQELADFVKFKPRIGQTTGCAWTDPSKKRRPYSKGLRGVMSTIYYSPRILGALTRATEKLHETRDVPLLLAMRFQFAVQLAHEACHALVFANDGHRRQFNTEPFFPGDKTAEVGFKLEDLLFGGHFAFLWADDPPDSEHAQKCHRKEPDESGGDEVSDLVGLPVVWPWPSPSVVKQYQHQNCGLWILKDDLKAVKRDSKEIGWRVSLMELSKFFQMSFWSQRRPQTRLDRDVGFVFNSGKEGRKVPFDMARKKLEGQIPEGYKLTGNKAIVKK